MSEPTREEKCFRYVLSVLLGDAGAALLARGMIHYVDPDNRSSERVEGLYIIPSGFFGAPYGVGESLPEPPLGDVKGVPLLYGAPEVTRADERLVTRADIIASAYFLLTRYEEMVRRDCRDAHGRFPGSESLAFRAGFLDRPLVDEYAALLRGWLRQIGIDVPEPKREFSALLTHDVDLLRKRRQPLRSVARVLLRRGSWGEAGAALATAVGLKQDPFDTFDEMISLDASLIDEPNGPKAKAVFFFMAGGRASLDGNYRITSRQAKAVMEKVTNAGARIALHASYDAGQNPDLIAGEKGALERASGRAIRGNRHHYVAWREIEDGRALARAGIEWDSTLGYADMAGFRLGVCRPIPLFDPIRLESMGIQEHPLVAMDVTLSAPCYMGLDEEGAFAHCKRLIEQTRKHNGEFVMLWHNNNFEERPGNYHPRLYRRILAELGATEFDNP